MSDKTNIRTLDTRGTFDATTVSFFISDEYKHEYYNVLGFFNSKIGDYFIKVLNPTLVFQLVDIRNTPFIAGNNEIIEKVKECVSISTTDWNSHENSWDFSCNSLLKEKDNNLTDIEYYYGQYKHYWQLRFIQLHKLEEALNKDYLKIYGLENEINPIIPLEDVTILQDELDRNKLIGINKKLIRDDNFTVINYESISLPFLSKEVFSQLLSFSVGCMLGRYSVDREGLILANQGETLEYYFQIIEKNKNLCTFQPDEDNIIPILDDEWFEDDIVSSFSHFLNVTFGENNFNKNLAFIEEQIGKDIRKYFIKDFYPDHIKRYKKRPIYWMFSSPKGSFNVLIYMHRYTPDTVSNILNKYLKEFIGKLNTRKEHLERVKETGSASDKTKAIKESDNIQKMLVELHEYERDILYPLATERIEIDLDDGVLVNYNKFGKAVKEVNGLNDTATKKKVKQFDWIDTSQIK